MDITIEDFEGKADGMVIQTLIFNKEKFTKEQAVEWAGKHNFKNDKVDETENSFRLRQKNPGDFDESTFRTIELKDGVQAVVGKIKKNFEGFREQDLQDVKTFDIKKDSLEVLEKEKSIIHFISTPDLDLGGDVVDPKGMDFSWFEKHRTVFYNHNYNLPIGKNLWLKKKEGEGILAKTQFSQTNMFADDIYNLHKEGILSTWSIGWRPKKKNGKTVEDALSYDEVNRITHINKSELIEYSSAPLAMNPNALDQMKCLCKSAFAKTFITEKEKEMVIQKSIDEQGRRLDEIAEMLSELTKLMESKVNHDDLGNLEIKLLDLEQKIENKKIEIENNSMEIVGKTSLTNEKMAELVNKGVAGAISRYINKK